MVGLDAIEKYETEIHSYFTCCPLCGDKQLKLNLVPGGRDSLVCEACKADWHLLIGLGGFQWAILEHPSENGEGKTLVGRRFDKQHWKKLSEKANANREAELKSQLKNQPTHVVRETEIIREKQVIVKIRCAYCRTTYDETLNKCPECGARN